MAMDSEAPARAVSIARIAVRGLFGQFDYDLPGKGDDRDLSRTFILYGDNGSGKTTILNLVFHLLSPVLVSGHRTFVARSPFDSIEVTFDDGSYVSAEKRRGSLLVIVQGKDYFRHDFEINEDNAIREPERSEGLIDALQSLGVVVNLISETRTVQLGRALPEEDDLIWSFDPDTRVPSRQRARRPQARQRVEEALERLHEWVRKAVIAAAQTGAENANEIYGEVVRTLASSVRDTTSTPLDAMMRSLAELQDRSEGFARFGLLPRFDAEILSSSMKSTSGHNADLISRILAPYVDGVKARLDALAEVKERLEAFTNVVNSFYFRNSVDFTVSQGLRIQTGTEEVLAPNDLSSGEKQLLLLFCNTLAAGEESNIILIDEPEISLNIKWQRQLIAALLKCTRQTQFIFASHSIELISQHDNNVVMLDASEK